MSSMLLDARQITRRRGARTVLDAVDIQAPDEGLVRRFGEVGYLPQFADVDQAGLTVRQRILDGVGLVSASRALDRWASVLAAGDLDAVGPHAAALERWLALGGADIDARLLAAVGELGVDASFLDRRLCTLSGGQAARAGLATLALARFAIVLLDEPTNHLDTDGLRRLAGLLAAHEGGVVLASHDRALLARTVSEIVELDRRTGRATHYRGGWIAYERERATTRARARSEHERALERRERLVAAETETRRRAAASLNRAGARVHDNDKHSREWVRMRAQEMAGRATGTLAANTGRGWLPWTKRSHA